MSDDERSRHGGKAICRGAKARARFVVCFTHNFGCNETRRSHCALLGYFQPAINRCRQKRAGFSISPRSVCRVLHKGFHVSKRRCARGFILIRLRHEKTTEKNILVSTKRVLIRLLFGMTRRIKRILPKCQVCRELQPLGKRLLRLKNGKRRDRTSL